MKWSKYNIFFYSTKYSCYLLYNMLSGFFIEVDEILANKIFNIKNDSQTIKELSDEEVKIFTENKILVESDDVELNKLKVAILANRFDSRNMHLTIAPTQSCNFKCKYCFEKDRPNKYMNKSIETSIVNFVKKKNINKLNVCWYGGEPLLAKGTIRSLTKELKHIVYKYNASIVTNGYLLDEDFIMELDELNIKYIQITLDGNKDTHNYRRPHETDNNSFDNIVKNIQSLIRLKPRIQLSIRVNVDKQNINEFADVYKLIKAISSNIHIYPGFVHDTSTSCNLSPCLLNRNEKNNFYKKLYSQHGIYIKEMIPQLTQSSCMARQLNSFLIDPNGNLYKCWHHLGVYDKIVGNICSEQTFYNYGLIAQYLLKRSIADYTKCNQCKYFIVCGGGCPDLKFIEKNNESYCSIFKNNIASYLEMKYEYLMKKQQTNDRI